MAVGAFVGSGVGAWAATAIGRPILHVGLTIMALGTTVLYVSLHSIHGGVGVFDLAPGLAVFGIGMGMIFVPLFSIIMGEIDDHEVGSASGLLESLQQLGASLGVAVLATLFFGKIRLEDGGPHAAMTAGRHLVAAQDTLLMMLGLVAVAWVVGWLLPRKARRWADSAQGGHRRREAGELVEHHLGRPSAPSSGRNSPSVEVGDRRCAIATCVGHGQHRQRRHDLLDLLHRAHAAGHAAVADEADRLVLPLARSGSRWRS